MDDSSSEISLARALATSTLIGGLVAGLSFLIAYDVVAQPCTAIMCNIDFALEALLSSVVLGSAVFWSSAAALVGGRLKRQDRWLTVAAIVVAGPILALIASVLAASLT